MYLRSDQGPEGSRLSLRVAVLSGVALVLFAILFFRLWNLQVLAGDEYLAEAKNNRTREYKVIAPRGEILDRNGDVLVDNRTSLALQLNTMKLPEDPAEERAQLARLGQLLKMPLRKVRRTIAESEEVAAGAPVTLKQDVGFNLIAYLEENQDEFPGVTVQRVFVRHYPDETRAAHVLGSVAEISEEELKDPRYKGLEPGDEIGQAGVEHSYDGFLRGEPGFTRIQVNALGQPTPGGQLVSEPPTPGENLKLTIDAEAQAAGEAGLAAYGHGGFISMNIETGEILALGSNPTFDPTDLIEPTQAEVDLLYRDSQLAPLVNRATEGVYPTGSIFKFIPALAALENGKLKPEETIYDPGLIVIGGQTFKNAGSQAYGSVALVKALEVSSDVYFYTLGARMWDSGELQDWASKLGIARPTGLDLPEEAEGLLPTKKWRDDLAAEGLAEERPWSIGDNVQLATGQGDLQTSPLQMAVAYAALGNGGKIVTPHVGLGVEDAAGRVLREFEPEVRRKVRINPGYRRTILEGLHQAAQGPEGTGTAIFGDFPIDIAGKTGTAERVGYGDQSWFAALSPYPDPRIVTIATVEEGGFGAEAAAPVVLRILEALYDEPVSEASGTGETE
ncbi:MAG TPA: penicillin-binding protein 2 [Solirubrobacterales bacterium]|nr:penicillin-binding protein 2 [Solirubrobacterales bacterium]